MATTTTLQKRLEGIIENISNTKPEIKKAIDHVKFITANNYDADYELIIYYFFDELTENTAYGYQITEGNGLLEDKTISWSEFIKEINQNSNSTYKINKPLFDDSDNLKLNELLNKELK